RRGEASEGSGEGKASSDMEAGRNDCGGAAGAGRNIGSISDLDRPADRGSVRAALAGCGSGEPDDSRPRELRDGEVSGSEDAEKPEGCADTEGACRAPCELVGGCDIARQPRGYACFCEWEGIGPYRPSQRSEPGTEADGQDAGASVGELARLPAYKQ